MVVGGGSSHWWDVTVGVGGHGDGRLVRSGAGWVWEGTSWWQESQQLKFMMEGGHGCWSIYLLKESGFNQVIFCDEFSRMLWAPLHLGIFLQLL